jgi:hypothetical protein
VNDQRVLRLDLTVRAKRNGTTRWAVGHEKHRRSVSRCCRETSPVALRLRISNLVSPTTPSGLVFHVYFSRPSIIYNR